MSVSPKKTVLVFGVFDGLDMGHQYFLHEAKKLGEKLIVIVTRDTQVEKLKHKCAYYSQEERLEKVSMQVDVTEAVMGDREQGTWEVLETYRPTHIAVGYDQEALKETLKPLQEKFNFEIVSIQKKPQS